MKKKILRGSKLRSEMMERPEMVGGAGEAVARVLTCGSGLTIQHAKAGRRQIPFSFFFSRRRRHTIFDCDWSSDVCSSDLVRNITLNNLRCGDTRSCGCWSRQCRTTHGQSGTHLYLVWANMIRRCYYPSHAAY